MQWKRQARKHVFLVAVSFVALCLLVGKASGQNIQQYVPIEMGFCEDVNLRCAAMIHEDTPIFYAVFSDDGKILAITKTHKGKEVVVWGKLPLKKDEKRL